MSSKDHSMHDTVDAPLASPETAALRSKQFAPRKTRTSSKPAMPAKPSAPSNGVKSEANKPTAGKPKADKLEKKATAAEPKAQATRKRAAAPPPVETEAVVAAPKTKKPRPPKAKKVYFEVSDESVEESWTEWKDVYFCGTEWENYARIFDHDWTFEHLWKYLSERENGTPEGHKIYMFGVTEPQFCKVDGQDQVVLIPAIVVVESKVAPPELISLKSVQLVEEIMVPFSRLKLSWRRVESTVIHALRCGARKEMIKKMPIERRNEFTYALPYILRKKDIEEASSGQETSVQVQVEREDNPPLLFDHDWEMDTIADRAQEICDDSGITDAAEIDRIKNAIKAAVKSKKEANAKDAEKIKARYDAFSSAQKDAYETMKVSKWYPENKNPEIEQWKTPFINRYWGRASEVL
eukprot:ANDGO_06823.mRNA.1 hypothetical protein